MKDRLHPLKLLIVVPLLFAGGRLEAQEPRPTEYQVEAAYLYNFGKFIALPENPSGSKTDNFTICILGQDPFGRILDSALAGEAIGGKAATAKRIFAPEEAVSCQILFISSSESIRLNKILKTLDRNAILTVSDMAKFSQRGGMIQFITEGNRIRFEINLAATQSSGLTLSSELLKVAVAVRGNPSLGN
jgi:hypothetical protein